MILVVSESMEIDIYCSNTKTSLKRWSVFEPDKYEIYEDLLSHVTKVCEKCVKFQKWPLVGVFIDEQNP